MITLLISIIFFTGVMSPSYELDTIIEGIKYNNSLLTSGKGYATFHRTVTDVNGKEIGRYEMVGYFAFDGEKLRQELKRETESIIDEIVFDGECTKALRRELPDKMSGYIRPKRQTFLFDDELDIRHWMHWWGTPIDVILEKHRNSTTILSSEIVEGDLRFTIEVRFPDGRKGVVVINFSKGCKPQEVREYRANGKLLSQYIMQLAKMDNIWYPKSVNLTTYTSMEDIIKQETKIKTIIQFRDFNPNVNIPADEFLLTFPKGTPVLDSVWGKAMIFGTD